MRNQWSRSCWRKIVLRDNKIHLSRPFGRNFRPGLTPREAARLARAGVFAPQVSVILTWEDEIRVLRRPRHAMDVKRSVPENDDSPTKWFAPSVRWSRAADTLYAHPNRPHAVINIERVWLYCSVYPVAISGYCRVVDQADVWTSLSPAAMCVDIRSSRCKGV